MYKTSEMLVKIERITFWISHTKQVNVDFLKSVNAAELIQLVVDFVENQRLVVIGSEVPNDLVDLKEYKIFLLQPERIIYECDLNLPCSGDSKLTTSILSK